MGTRVDFYVGRGEQAEWLGSYPFDGNPEGVFGDNPDVLGTPPATEQQWREWVTEFLGGDNADIATLPEDGWPWPWANSQSTDYAYAWDAGTIYGSSFGHRWFAVDLTAENYGEDEDRASDKSAIFPDMTGRQAVTFGPRSGLIVFGG